MTPPKGEAKRLAYVKRCDGAFRGWYFQDGEQRFGPLMETEARAHHWAIQKREELERRSQEALSDLLREIIPDVKSNKNRARAYGPAEPDESNGLKSIPLRDLGHDERGAAGAALPVRLDLPRKEGRDAATPERPAADPQEPPVDGGLRKLDGAVHDFIGPLDPTRKAVADTRLLDAEHLASLFAFTPPRNHALGAPVLFGTSPAIALEGMLSMLGSLGKTGLLCVQAGAETFMLSVVEGDIVHGVSYPRPESELLGNVLVERGFIERDELDGFLEEHGSSVMMMGEALTKHVLVSEEELRTALEHQMLCLFDRLLEVESSEWCFHESDVSLAYIDMRMSVIRLLLESARKRDESQVPGRGDEPGGDEPAGDEPAGDEPAGDEPAA